MRCRPIRLVLVLALVAPVPDALAQGTSYRDADGKLHIVDDPAAVPSRYRDGARPLGGDAPPEATPGRPARPRDPGPSSAAASPAPTASAHGPPPSCTLEFVGKPEKRHEGRQPQVTFLGELENTGTGRARGVQIEAKVYAADDGRLLDDVLTTLRPSILDPGDRGTFEVTADYRKQNNRNPAKDEVRISVARCDPFERAAGAGEPPVACEVEMVGSVQKSTDAKRGTLTARAQLRNNGPGTARSVQMRWTTREIDTAEVIEVHLDAARPLVLEPGETATWEKTIDLDFGVRSPKRDTFEIVVERCR